MLYRSPWNPYRSPHPVYAVYRAPKRPHSQPALRFPAPPCRPAQSPPQPAGSLQAIWIILRYAGTNDIYDSSSLEILSTLSGARRFNPLMANTVRPYVGKQVLEIGAGIGNLTRLLAPRRACYLATVIDEEHLARLQVRFPPPPQPARDAL